MQHIVTSPSLGSLVWQNQAQHRSWLQLFLQTTECNRSGLNARADTTIESCNTGPTSSLHCSHGGRTRHFTTAGVQHNQPITPDWLSSGR